MATCVGERVAHSVGIHQLADTMGVSQGRDYPSWKFVVSAAYEEVSQCGAR